MPLWWIFTHNNSVIVSIVRHLFNLCHFIAIKNYDQKETNTVAWLVMVEGLLFTETFILLH